MSRRWQTVIDKDTQFRAAFPEVQYRKRRVDSGGRGRMRKHRPNEGCGCHMCQWEKWTKGKGKRKQLVIKHELFAEGVG